MAMSARLTFVTGVVARRPCWKENSNQIEMERLGADLARQRPVPETVARASAFYLTTIGKP
jgi:hypothetical protein